jgi:hypothetical protein
MTKKRSEPAATDSQAPFGTRPRKSKGPLLLLGGLYLAWLALLFWMAVFESGN